MHTTLQAHCSMPACLLDHNFSDRDFESFILESTIRSIVYDMMHNMQGVLVGSSFSGRYQAFLIKNLKLDCTMSYKKARNIALILCTEFKHFY